MDCVAKNNIIECKVIITDCSDSKRILTLRNTLDEILMIIKSLEGMLEKVEVGGEDL